MMLVVYGCIIGLSWFGAKYIVTGELTTGELTLHVQLHNVDSDVADDAVDGICYDHDEYGKRKAYIGGFE